MTGIMDLIRKIFSDENYAVEHGVGYLLSRARTKLARAIDLELLPYEITHAQGSILLMLASGNYTTAAELARELYIDSASMTRMVDRLEKRGLLRRVPRTDDRRVINLCLTAEGQHLGALLPKLYTGVLNRSFAAFSAMEIDQLRHLLHKLVDGEADSKPGAPPTTTPHPTNPTITKAL
jgi:DNA-binding MarR family transcriptional regulator